MTPPPTHRNGKFLIFLSTFIIFNVSNSIKSDFATLDFVYVEDLEGFSDLLISKFAFLN